MKEKSYRRGGDSERLKKKMRGEKNESYVSEVSAGRRGFGGVANTGKVSGRGSGGYPSTSLSIPARISSLKISSDGGDEDGVERGRVRQLENEVSVLERQLVEKTKTAQSHLEEVTCVRSELARERASLARVR